MTLSNHSEKNNMTQKLYLFTPLQKNIIKGLLYGLPNKKIAYHLHLSTGVIKYQTGIIYKILGVSKREEVILKIKVEQVKTNLFEDMSLCLNQK